MFRRLVVAFVVSAPVILPIASKYLRYLCGTLCEWFMYWKVRFTQSHSVREKAVESNLGYVNDVTEHVTDNRRYEFGIVNWISQFRSTWNSNSNYGSGLWNWPIPFSIFNLPEMSFSIPIPIPVPWQSQFQFQFHPFWFSSNSIPIPNCSQPWWDIPRVTVSNYLK